VASVGKSQANHWDDDIERRLRRAIRNKNRSRENIRDEYADEVEPGEVGDGHVVYKRIEEEE